MVAKKDQQPGDVASATAVPHEPSGHNCQEVDNSLSERRTVPAGETCRWMGVNGSKSMPISKTKLKRKLRAHERKNRSKAATHKEVRN